MTTSRELLAIERQKENVRLKRDELIKSLPHLYERKWYAWAWNFFQSRNKMNLLTAANQISKSSTQIRKCIEWAGNPKLWPELWPNHTPRIFWYFYPDADTVKAEVENKWIPEFLPRGAYKDHPTYGWQIVYGERKMIDAIKFNSGILLAFKTYSQKAVNLQSSTLAAVFIDEELPMSYYPEIMARLIASGGYFSSVFTATLNQPEWKRAMEGKGDSELFPQAYKQQISMFDCLFYKDGTPGGFTEERIHEIIASCSSEAEVQRRVYGKFVASEGLKYGSFDASRHFIKPHRVPNDWRLYCAVDVGSGGTNHKPAIAFVAVNPEFRKGVVYRSWRGDDGSTYTSGDIFNKFLEMRKGETFVAQRYDGAAADFGTIAARAGENFQKAMKKHDEGEDVVNTLFKHDMLHLFDNEENQKMGGELSTLLKETAKNKAIDDLCDALRYCVVTIPWDWLFLKGLKSEIQEKIDEKKPYTQEELDAFEIKARRGQFTDDRGQERDDWSEADDEINFWNECAGS